MDKKQELVTILGDLAALTSFSQAGQQTHKSPGVARAQLTSPDARQGKGNGAHMETDIPTFAAMSMQAGKTAVESTPTNTSMPTVASAMVSVGNNGQVSQEDTNRYRILRPHARGGLGTVSVALDSELNREVALKEILPHYAGDHESRRRFTREAEVTGRLEHPGIVPVYGLGWHSDGRPYYAMRFIRGSSLKESIQQLHQKGADASPTELRSLLNRFVDVCNAIAFAHSRGIIHRDIKPANIMLGEYGETLVVDWGLAKALGSTCDDGDSLPQLGPLMSDSMGEQTRNGSALGTPAYMSPEQAAGKVDKLGPASDIYSLGATLYTLLTGQLPFQGRELVSLLAHVQAGKFPRPRQINSKISRALEAICLKAMALEPEKRYTTATELAKDLERWMADEPVTAYKEPWTARVRRWGRHHRAIVAAGAGLCVTAVIALSVISSLVTLAHARIKAAKDDEAIARQEAIEEGLKAKQSAEENRQLLVKNQLADGFSLMEKGDLLSAQVWFAEALRQDEGQPARERAHRIRLAAVQRESPKLELIHASDDGVRDACFSPDGRRVAIAAGDAVRIWDIETGEAVSPPLQHKAMISSIAFSPDGKRLATASRDNTARIWNWADGRALSQPLRHDGPVAHVVFSPDGALLATGASDQTIRLWDGSTGLPQGTPLEHQDRIDQLVFHPRGHRLAAISGHWDELLGAGNGGDLIVWDLATMKPAFPPITDPEFAFTHVEFSPEGGQFVAASLDGTARIFDVSTGKPAGPKMKHSTWVEIASYSHDGSRIATACSDGIATVWDAKSGERILAHLHHDGAVRFLCWSLDDARLLTACEDGTATVWDTATGEPSGYPMRHSSNIRFAVFSPDNKRVLTLGGGLHNREARVWRPNDGDALKPALPILDENIAATLSNDLKRVAVVTTQGQVFLRDRLSHQSWALAGAKDVQRAWICPNGEFVATVNSEGTLRLCQLVGVETNNIPLNAPPKVLNLVFDHSSECFAIQSSAKTVQLWSIRSGMPVTDQLEVDRPITHMAFSPDDEVLVVTAGGWESQWEGTPGGMAYLWNVTTGKQILPPLEHEGSIQHANFSPDGSQLVTSGSCRDAGETHIWSLKDGKEVTTIRHRGLTNYASFSPDGKKIVTSTGILAYSAGETRIWDATTGDPLTPPMSHPGPVGAVAFDPNGDFLVTGCAVHSHRHIEVRVWDARNGEPLTAPVCRDGRNMDVAQFEADSSTLLFGADGNIWSMDLTPDQSTVEQIYARAQILADQRIDASGSLWPLLSTDMYEARQSLGDASAGFKMIGQTPTLLASQPSRH